MIEEWKDIKGYEGLYQVSNLGIVRSLYDAGHNLHRVKKLKPIDYTNGYKAINLHKEKKQKTFLIHRLVAEAFLPNTENKREVNHKNGDKSDNRVVNLEWVTPKENSKHAYLTGLHIPDVESMRKGWNEKRDVIISKLKKKSKGEGNSQAKITEKNVLEIRKMFANGFAINLIAQKIGIDRRTISLIVKGQRWSHLPYSHNIAKDLKAKKVYRIKGDEIKLYSSIKEATRELSHGNHSRISACCRGKAKTAYGYIWRYAEDYDKEKVEQQR